MTITLHLSKIVLIISPDFTLVNLIQKKYTILTIVKFDCRKFINMYKGTNKTALLSQQQIADAFFRLLKEYPYSSVSISAICKEACISRQTFYSLFESKENLVTYMLSKKHRFTPGSVCCHGTMTIEELSREYSSFIIERRDFLKLLVQNDIIYLMHESMYKSFIECSIFLPGMDEKMREFGAEFVSSGLSGIAKIYVENENTTCSELEDIISSLFSGSFFKNCL